MKIMHLISSIGLFGAEKLLLDLATEQNRAGTEAWVVGLKNLYNPHEEVLLESEKRGLPVFPIESRHRFDLGCVGALSEFIRVNEIQLIHTHNIKADIHGVLAGAKTKTPVVATNHGWTDADAKLRFYETIDAFVLRHFVKRVVAVSRSAKEWMLKRGIPPDKIDIVRNGTPLRESKVASPEARKQLGLTDDALTIGAVGRLSPEKGHRFLIEAAGRILEKDPRVRFVVFGEGPSQSELEGLVNSRGLKDKVTLAGFQPDPDVIYGALDILVQPSLREATPLVILEAMSFGKPIIAARVGGVPDLITDNETGVLIPPASVEALSGSIMRLLKDGALRVRLGERAREVARREFSVEKMTQSYSKVYEEVLR